MTARTPSPRTLSTPCAAARPTAADPSVAQRWRSNLPLLVAGWASVVAGGLAAAVTGPTRWTEGSWVAAFLVLVAGVAQLGIAAGQAYLTGAAPSAAFVAAQCAMWNLGCAAVITGTLLGSPLIVSAGSAPLLVVLVTSMIAARRRPTPHSVAGFAYRLLLLVVIASIPIGIALSFARH